MKRKKLFLTLDVLSNSDWLEERLQTEHAQGWRLVTYNWLGFFTFEKCQPADVVYRFEFSQGFWTAGMVRIYQDAGWTKVLDRTGILLLKRKLAAEERSSDALLYEDRRTQLEARLPVLKRLVWGEVFIFLFILYLLYTIFTGNHLGVKLHWSMFIAFLSLVFLSRINAFGTYYRAKKELIES